MHSQIIVLVELDIQISNLHIALFIVCLVIIILLLIRFVNT